MRNLQRWNVPRTDPATVMHCLSFFHKYLPFSSLMLILSKLTLQKNLFSLISFLRMPITAELAGGHHKVRVILPEGLAEDQWLGRPNYAVISLYDNHAKLCVKMTQGLCRSHLGNPWVLQLSWITVVYVHSLLRSGHHQRPTLIQLFQILGQAQFRHLPKIIRFIHLPHQHYIHQVLQFLSKTHCEIHHFPNSFRSTEPVIKNLIFL